MRVMTIAARPTGMFRKKIQRHDAWVSRPPRTGAHPRPKVMTALQIPRAVPSSRPLNVCASSASEVAKTVAPPTPCSARKAMSSRPEPAMPHSSEPTVNAASPAANTRRRPRMSASDPAGSSSAASDSE
jgi:hypothetical protein